MKATLKEKKALWCQNDQNRNTTVRTYRNYEDFTVNLGRLTRFWCTSSGMCGHVTLFDSYLLSFSGYTRPVGRSLYMSDKVEVHRN
jgi:hypothetical protein